MIAGMNTESLIDGQQRVLYTVKFSDDDRVMFGSLGPEVALQHRVKMMRCLGRLLAAAYRLFEEQGVCRAAFTGLVIEELCSGRGPDVEELHRTDEDGNEHLDIRRRQLPEGE